ncbi:hypothetical protein LX97_01573 [Nonlabens dokdonensis]|jgi:hypothetical protein|uniref:Secreted protein n=2 Tax=Nonlabens dokdonensis TaxID=328515 RepID=L7WBL3_NONDD|nr:hypothetical protein [Nonlabens dokdonensis]AGC77266.1 secreted protein [Nonlabens dokdonensis DSW-6]PZX40801.1 hypothetical protein LX97_01573 [Nonlabens dokdonensis]
MFKALKNIGITIMAAIVLCSTLSFSVHKHFCGPFLKDVSVIVPSHGCGMETNNPKDLCKISIENSCCNDIVELVKGQEDLKLSLSNFDIDQQQFLIAFTYSYVSLFSGNHLEDPSYTTYSPPLVVRDIPVLHQSFLI